MQHGGSLLFIVLFEYQIFMRTNKSLLILAVSSVLFVQYSWSEPVHQEAKLIQNLDDQRMQNQMTDSIQEQWRRNTPTKEQPLQEQPPQEQTVNLDDAELIQQPFLLTRALSSAVLMHQMQDVAYLLPLYQKLPEQQQDVFLVTWANAILLEKQGEYRQAAEIYQALLSQRQHFVPLRLRFALMLYAQKKYQQAQSQFAQLTQQSLPKDVLFAIEKYQQTIKEQYDWQVQLGANLINDKNINNAPKNRDLGGGWIAPEPQAAQGLSAWINTYKKWPTKQDVYVDFRNFWQIKQHWKNKGYNEVTANFAFGVGHQNQTTEVSIAPFVERSWYADGQKEGKLSYFSQNYGISLRWYEQFSPRWQGYVLAQYAKQYYPTRPHLDGFNVSLNTQMNYFPDHHALNRMWFFGVDYQKKQAQQKDDSFVRANVKAGVLQNWESGWAMQAMMNVAKKEHQQAGFFGKVQQNHEYGTQVSLWHNRWHWYNLTPKLTWQYQKVDSNLPLYRYEKQNVFLELQKRF